MGRVADTVMARFFSPSVLRSPAADVDSARRTLLATNPTGYAGCCAAIRDMDLRDRLGQIRAPTLVISAAEDPATPPEHGELIRDSIPGADFEIVPDASHLANIERPDVVTRAILEHLEPVVRQGR